MNVVKVNRRDFVKITSAASAGLVLALQMPRARAAQDDEYPLGAFVQIGTDGLVTIYVAKSDMGQGVRTALPMIVADEMDADWTKVRIRQADLDKKYGRQGTGGSSSIRTMWTPMRQAGATARAMLVTAAATKWGVDAKDITVANGVLSQGTHTAKFADLAAAASKLDVPKEVTLKDPAKFKIVGRKVDRLDNRDLIRGKGS
ncbi:MAG TPA: molybdopterin cofactor-binding domain-containing protein, partial [Thermoanaerobaculia bacterium]|nr:molybdopterin cofactor-binding domain-containing protein [Thermoanaerobaculia bacterium]